MCSVSPYFWLKKSLKSPRTPVLSVNRLLSFACKAMFWLRVHGNTPENFASSVSDRLWYFDCLVWKLCEQPINNSEMLWLEKGNMYMLYLYVYTLICMQRAQIAMTIEWFGVENILAFLPISYFITFIRVTFEFFSAAN